MAKVYVVHSGEYSDRRIRAVFTDKAKAEAFQQYADRDNAVEEWELDSAEIPEWYQNGFRTYMCQAKEDGMVTTDEINVEGDPEQYGGDEVHSYSPYDKGFMWTYCCARSESHAIKIAADRFAKWKAQQAGIA
jgi:hypothetical protein